MCKYNFAYCQFGGTMIDLPDSEHELDRLCLGIVQQLIAGYPKARRNARAKNGFKIVINVHNGHSQAHIEWPPETTGVEIPAIK